MVLFVEENEPKEWVAQVEPGVLITFVSLPRGGNDLKRIRFRYVLDCVMICLLLCLVTLRGLVSCRVCNVVVFVGVGGFDRTVSVHVG